MAAWIARNATRSSSVSAVDCSSFSMKGWNSGQSVRSSAIGENTTLAPERRAATSAARAESGGQLLKTWMTSVRSTPTRARSLVQSTGKPPEKPLTLAAYEAGPVKVAYVEPVAVGDVLPDMPLFLAPETHVLAALEATCQTA